MTVANVNKVTICSDSSTTAYAVPLLKNTFKWKKQLKLDNIQYKE